MPVFSEGAKQTAAGMQAAVAKGKQKVEGRNIIGVPFLGWVSEL